MKSAWTKMKHLWIYFHRDSRLALIYHLTSHHTGSHLLYTSRAVFCTYCSSDYALRIGIPWSQEKKALIYNVFSSHVLEGCSHYLAFHAVLGYPKQSIRNTSHDQNLTIGKNYHLGSEWTKTGNFSSFPTNPFFKSSRLYSDEHRKVQRRL